MIRASSQPADHSQPHGVRSSCLHRHCEPYLHLVVAFGTANEQRDEPGPRPPAATSLLTIPVQLPSPGRLPPQLPARSSITGRGPGAKPTNLPLSSTRTSWRVGCRQALSPAPPSRSAQQCRRDNRSAERALDIRARPACFCSGRISSLIEGGQEGRPSDQLLMNSPSGSGKTSAPSRSESIAP